MFQEFTGINDTLLAYWLLSSTSVPSPPWHINISNITDIQSTLSLNAFSNLESCCSSTIT